MNSIRSLGLIALLVASGAIQGAEFEARVIAVLDGDTVLIRRDGGLVKIRLAEIDAPEVGHAGMGGKAPDPQKAQSFGETSKRSLSGMVLGKQVRITTQAVDQYGRMVAHLGLDGLDVNAEQVRRGMAWEYSHYHGNKVLVALQRQARQAPRGLWALSDPMPPWEWRKLHPGTPPHADAPEPETANARQPNPAGGCKKRCSGMASCEEARHYLKLCGPEKLDGDRDGVPCEKLCQPDTFRKDQFVRERPETGRHENSYHAAD
jgi:endonuclease YncB( thermonuclease family)